MTRLLIASGSPIFFTEVAAIIVGGALVAYLANRIKLIPIVGFLLAGVLIGPNALGFVKNQELVDSAAEIGVVLLLFSIGIEFSLEKLSKIQKLIFGGGGLQVGLASVGTMLLMMPFGVSWQAGLFSGFLISLSSTAIVLKLLAERGETNTEHGQVQLGLLIFQDLAIIVMVMLVPMISPKTGMDMGQSLLEILWAMSKAVAIIVVVLIFARRIMPKVLEVVSRTCSQEIFLLTIVAICFGTAYLTSLAGVSLSLGAFLAGLVVSESKFSEHALGEILPLQILFSATFFVSVGMLLNLSFLFQHLPLILLSIVLVLVIKVVTTGLSVFALGYKIPTITISSLMLAQIGEFSFVLEKIGRETGLYPAGVEEGSQAFIVATVVLMLITPTLASFGNKLALRLKQKKTAEELVTAAPELDSAATLQEFSDHLIFAGYGEVAKKVASKLNKIKEPSFLIITLSPSGANEAEQAGMTVLRGDSTRQRTLQLAQAERAKALLILDDEIAQTIRIVSIVRALNPNVMIIAKTQFEADRDHLLQAGASIVLVDETSMIHPILSHIAREFKLNEEILFNLNGHNEHRPPSEKGKSEKLPYNVKTIYFSTTSAKCSHLGDVVQVIPSSIGCEECLAQGLKWVHLRICMTCGHVGCCDSSPNQHARKHFETSGHPIIRSYEKGEQWGWCFIDNIELIHRKDENK